MNLPIETKVGDTLLDGNHRKDVMESDDLTPQKS
jgi:hypothetical protein